MQPATSSWWSTGKNAPKSSDIEKDPDVRSLSLWSFLFCVKVCGVGAMTVPASVVLWLAVGSSLVNVWVDVPPHRCVQSAGVWDVGVRPGSQAILRIVS